MTPMDKFFRYWLAAMLCVGLMFVTMIWGIVLDVPVKTVGIGIATWITLALGIIAFGTFQYLRSSPK